MLIDQRSKERNMEKVSKVEEFDKKKKILNNKKRKKEG